MTTNRISAAFQKLRLSNECGFICYVAAGYPDIQTSLRIIDSLVKGGADAIEIGIPFSDPIADGPTVQRALSSALQSGITPEKALSFARQVRERHPSLPMLGMTYFNILMSRGIERFLHQANRNGVDGFIVPDLPIEESQQLVQVSRQEELATVFLVSPNTNTERLNEIVKNTTGFLYLVSVYGITGTRTSFEDYTLGAVKNAKSVTAGKIPLAVGFGISRPSHVRLMKESGADAVIVGSAIVDIVEKSKSQKELFLSLEQFARGMKQACR